LDTAVPKVFGIRWGLRSPRKDRPSGKPVGASGDADASVEQTSDKEIEVQASGLKVEEGGSVSADLTGTHSVSEPVLIAETLEPTVPDSDELLKVLSPEVEKTIAALAAKKFAPDPLAGSHFSRMVSLFSSAYKRHGFILESAILARLSQNNNLQVWNDPKFYVSEAADQFAATFITDPKSAIGSEHPYTEEGRTLQVDVIVWDEERKTITAYEIKRGHGDHDAGKKRSILRDLLCVQVLLRQYAISRGLKAEKAFSRIVFYYGKCSIPKPFNLTRDELDDHFGFSVTTEVEAVNLHFRRRLFEILSD
jgi:hypothetical protein